VDLDFDQQERAIAYAVDEHDPATGTAALRIVRRRGDRRELRGIGPGIEARLRELVQNGEIAELAELERELSPELVGLGRYLGLTATRRRPDRTPRQRSSAGRRSRHTVPGIGPKREGAAARRARPRGRATATTRPEGMAPIQSADKPVSRRRSRGIGIQWPTRAAAMT
jgi:hypothetical protein